MIHFYQRGDRLIVEHFRENGEVYFHAQNVDETEVGWTRCARMPEERFDALLTQEMEQELSYDAVADLPAYSHWKLENV